MAQPSNIHPQNHQQIDSRQQSLQGDISEESGPSRPPGSHDLTNYRFSSHNHPDILKEQLNGILLKTGLTVVLVAVGLMVTCYILKYLIQSTSTFGPAGNCRSTDMAYDGWDFGQACYGCADGFEWSETGCRPV